MSNICGKCNKPGSNRDLLRCYGKCKTGFHPSCVDHKMESMNKLFKECPYAKFICLDCQHDFESNTSAELLSLKDQLCQLAQTVAALTSRMDDGFQKVVLDVSEKMSQLSLNAPAAVITAARDSNGRHNHVEAPPYVSPRFEMPQKDCIIGSCDDADVTIQVAQERKFIYASNFSNATLPGALCKFLCGKLAVSEDDMDCRLLVPANRDVSRLNFVSFKIGVAPTLFNKLLQPDIWPSGVLVREFVSRSKNLNPAVVNLLHH